MGRMQRSEAMLASRIIAGAITAGPALFLGVAYFLINRPDAELGASETGSLISMVYSLANHVERESNAGSLGSVVPWWSSPAGSQGKRAPRWSRRNPLESRRNPGVGFRN